MRSICTRRSWPSYALRSAAMEPSFPRRPALLTIWTGDVRHLKAFTSPPRSLRGLNCSRLVNDTPICKQLDRTTNRAGGRAVFTDELRRLRSARTMLEANAMLGQRRLALAGAWASCASGPRMPAGRLLKRTRYRRATSSFPHRCVPVGRRPCGRRLLPRSVRLPSSGAVRGGACGCLVGRHSSHNAG